MDPEIMTGAGHTNCQQIESFADADMCIMLGRAELHLRQLTSGFALCVCCAALLMALDRPPHAIPMSVSTVAPSPAAYSQTCTSFCST